MRNLKLYEFDIRHYNCFGCEFTEKFPEASIETNLFYSNGKKMILLDTLRSPDSQKFVDKSRRMPQIKKSRVIEKGKKKARILSEAMQPTYIKRIILKSGFQFDGPSSASNGVEHYRVIGMGNPKELFSELKEVGDIISRKSLDLGFSGINKIVSKNTPLYLVEQDLDNAFLMKKAVKAGLYDWPRKTNILELSKKLDMPRASLQASLRKAEGEIIKKAIK
ncbi:MAG: hypothetical protein CL943_02190 [Candidatus Diapherotrites archaeon]|uniref:HTH bat-type domain-containing protein n=1 Tax=Candidatus Iainarchaeum sp. TaxID=3101447 RepID=A0A2D6M100_9ARCH|nr:hypothetical protein [Candidatus Diapherotrites archaeon]|tara:strand:- start:1304 stop:1966 length:663 start_codon:yes stop_codon:yes gene_type:complete